MIGKQEQMKKKKVHTMNHSADFRMDYSKDGRRKIETNTFREIRESIKKDKRGENSHVPKKKSNNFMPHFLHHTLEGYLLYLSTTSFIFPITTAT